MTENDIDQLLLDTFTILLCKALAPVLRPDSCPATPKAGHTPYVMVDFIPSTYTGQNRAVLRKMQEGRRAD